MGLQQDDPQLKQILDKQKVLLEREYRESLEQVDKNFNLKKDEIMKSKD